MNKTTQTILIVSGLAVAGAIGFYFYNKQKNSGNIVTAATPPRTNTPAQTQTSSTAQVISAGASALQTLNGIFNTD